MSGYPISDSQKRLSFWAKLGSGTNLAAKLEVHWLDEDLNLLRTDQLSSPILTASWQEAAAIVTPPDGARYANIDFVHGSGTSGNVLYLDDVRVADN
jgi:hypothetical protein